MVSTGTQNIWERVVVRAHLKIRKLNIIDKYDLAYAA